MRKPKLVYGVGVNDVDYVVQKYQVTDRISPTSGKRIQKRIWVCPYYVVWKSMLKRCYSRKLHVSKPSYKGCTVCEDWKYFSKFKAWMESQDWEGKQLDKDILLPGNREYSPTNCVFVSGKINNFILERGRDRGEYPIGVSRMKRTTPQPVHGTGEHWT